MRITKKMSFSALLSKYPETIEVFLRYGMHCVGCVAASFETIEQGAKAHGIDPDQLVKDLNAAIKKKRR